jgi:hypothetical protein
MKTTRIIAVAVFISMGGSSGPRLSAETGGRGLELSFERTVECRFGLIAYFGRDLGYRTTRRCQQLRAQLESPTGEVGHRRFVEVVAKSLS